MAAGNSEISAHFERIRVQSIGSDDETSFVVLEHIDGDSLLRGDSLNPIEHEQLQEMQKLISMEIGQLSLQNGAPASLKPAQEPAATSVQSDNFSAHSSIEGKVESLIQENNDLKNTIVQNNLSMKTQYEKIREWETEVQKIWQMHKSKLTDVRMHVDKLKEANLKLTVEVEKYRDIKQLQDEEIITLKNQMKTAPKEGAPITNSVAINVRETELEEANKKLSESLKEYELKNKQLQDSQETLKNQNANLLEENEKLKAHIESSPKLNDELNIHQAKLNSLLHELGDKDQQIVEFRETNESLLKNNLDLANDFAEAEIKIAALEAERGVAEINEGQLKEHIGNLKTQLTSLEKTVDLGVQERCDKLEQQLMSSQILITKLEHDLKMKSDELEQKNWALNQSKQKSDEIFALKQQLEVFKNDFEAEKLVKESLKEQKNVIAEDLANLQRRNEQLLKEVETLRGNRASPSAPRATNSPTVTRYSCPVCNKMFRSLKLVEEHVEQCINLTP